MTSLTTVADPEAVAVKAAELLERLIGVALRGRGVAHLALAGGTTPRRTYELLKLESWENVELWFGDERCVPADDPESNYAMVASSLLPHARGAVVHRVPVELGAEAAADAYDALLRERLPGPPPTLDVALLGIGPDGHTASLFPSHPALDVAGALCVAVHDAPKPPPDRVSLSLEALSSARDRVVLAADASKADAVAAIIAGPDRSVPASLLPRDRLHLIVDDAASPKPLD
jgi:6-phosphogluconolactonase